MTVTNGPMRLRAGDFVERLADDLALEPDDARERVRAFFSVLREAVTGGELRDVAAQLDPEYADLLG